MTPQAVEWTEAFGAPPELPGCPLEKLLLTIEEAADVLSIGRTKVYELIAKGFLRSVCIDRSRRIPASALMEFVHGLEHGTPVGCIAAQEAGDGDPRLVS